MKKLDSTLTVEQAISQSACFREKLKDNEPIIHMVNHLRYCIENCSKQGLSSFSAIIPRIDSMSQDEYDTMLEKILLHYNNLGFTCSLGNCEGKAEFSMNWEIKYSYILKLNKIIQNRRLISYCDYEILAEVEKGGRCLSIYPSAIITGINVEEVIDELCEYYSHFGYNVIVQRFEGDTLYHITITWYTKEEQERADYAVSLIKKPID